MRNIKKMSFGLLFLVSCNDSYPDLSQTEQGLLQAEQLRYSNEPLEPLGTTTEHLFDAPSISPIGSKIIMASVGASLQSQVSERLSVRCQELSNK